MDTPPTDRELAAGRKPTPGFESRARRDRRDRPTPRLSRFSFTGGRRRGARRDHERDASFVDLYGSGLLLAVLWVALLNAADSFFTIVHLQSGGSEANPIANLLLMTGRVHFVWLKSGIISLALLVLCVHKNFGLARIGLWTSAGAYTMLFAYHIFLFFV